MSEHPDKELEDLLAQSRRARDAYRAAAADEQPLAEIDAAILAASRRQVGARPYDLKRGFVARWRVPLSMAAVLVLGTSLSLLFYEDKTHEKVMSDLPAPAAAPAAAPETQEQRPDGAGQPQADAQNGIAESAQAPAEEKRSEPSAEGSGTAGAQPSEVFKQQPKEVPAKAKMRDATAKPPHDAGIPSERERKSAATLEEVVRQAKEGQRKQEEAERRVRIEAESGAKETAGPPSQAVTPVAPGTSSASDTAAPSHTAGGTPRTAAAGASTAPASPPPAAPSATLPSRENDGAASSTADSRAGRSGVLAQEEGTQKPAEPVPPAGEAARLGRLKGDTADETRAMPSTAAAPQSAAPAAAPKAESSADPEGTTQKFMRKKQAPAELSATRLKSPDAWLEDIKLLWNADRKEEARTQLREFFKKYPDYALPSDFPLSKPDSTAP